MTSNTLKLYQAALRRLVNSQSISSGVKISCDELAKAGCRKRTPSRHEDNAYTASISNTQAQRTQTIKDDLIS